MCGQHGVEKGGVRKLDARRLETGNVEGQVVADQERGAVV
jgi:hypothetical protein